MTNLILVTGATRSGKSEWAETLAQQSGLAVVYVATAQMDESDPEWQARIIRHQQRRPLGWTTLHVPENLVGAIAQSTSNQCLLIDSLGTWLANGLEDDDATWAVTCHHLLSTLSQATSQIIIVAEETGWGVVPAYPSGRTFRDRLGQLTREIAAIANSSYLVVAGFALNLQHLGIPVLSSRGENL